MRKISFTAYMVSLGVIVLMLLYIQFGLNVSVYREMWDTSCKTIENYEKVRVDDRYAPRGVTYEYRWLINDIPENGSCITFYSVHNYVQMYVGEEKVYDLEPMVNNRFGKTSGCLWPQAIVTSSDNGKYFTLRVSPVYSDTAGEDVTIYCGTEQGVFLHIIKDNLLVALLGMITFVVGILLMILAVGYKFTGERENGIFMLGIFAVEAGLWKLADMSAAMYIFSNPLTASAIALILLAAMPTSFVMFVRYQFSFAKKPVWDYIGMACSALSVILVILQWNNIADFRQTLWLTHLIIVVVMIMLVGLIVWEAKHSHWSDRLVVTIMCTLLCVFGMAIDMFVYYRFNSDGNMFFGVAALLIYVVIMAGFTIHDTRELMDIGMEAQRFEKLALHDRLTGLYNRTYYEDFVQNIDLDKGNCFFIVFDVNNLKTCNDTMGHDHGDVLIKNAANLIKEVFGANGACCRIGGDEFYVVLQGISLMQLEEWLKEFDILTTKHNLDHPDQFEIKVAYGYARYDYRVDYDFAATVRRADKMMYEKKTEMKKKK